MTIGDGKQPAEKLLAIIERLRNSDQPHNELREAVGVALEFQRRFQKERADFSAYVKNVLTYVHHEAYEDRLKGCAKCGEPGAYDQHEVWHTPKSGGVKLKGYSCEGVTA